MSRLPRPALFCAASLIAFSAAGIARAQDQDQALPVTTVDELIVQATSLEQTVPLELSRLGNDIEILESDEIRDQIFVDIPDALRMGIAGIYVAPRAGPFSYNDLSLQGSRLGDVLWLVDGVRINNRLYNTTSPADTLPVNMVERIEVLKGGQSLFYGTSAAAGVINVVTRAFSNAPGGEVTVGMDTNAGYHASGYGRGAVGRNQFVIYGSVDQAKGYNPFTAHEPSATDNNRGYNVASYGLKYGINVTEDLRLNLRYQHTNAIIDYLRPTEIANGSNRRQEDVTSLNLDYTPNDNFQVFAKAYAHSWDSTYTDITNVIGSPGTVSVNDLNTGWWYYDSGLNLMAQIRPTPGIETLVGYDYQSYHGQDDVLLIENQAETVNAIFGQLRTTSDMFERGRFAFGARYNDTAGAKVTVWNASGHYDITDNFFVEATAGTSFILPDAYSLHAIDPFDVWGEPDLEPEEGQSFNVSVGGAAMNGNVMWQLTLFDRQIDNLITDDDSATTFKDGTPLPADAHFGVFINTPDRVNFNGYDAQVLVSLGSNWRFLGSYTHAEAESEGSPGVQLSRTPRDYAKASFVYEPVMSRFGGSVSTLWTGDVFRSTGVGAENYGDYVVVDLAAHYYLDDDKRTQLTVRVENLFDEEYSTRRGTADLDSGLGAFEYGFRGVPQTLHVGVTRRFGE